MTSDRDADEVEQEGSVFGECQRCGDTATLSAAGSDGVFRPICRDCFEENHKMTETRSPPDWRDALLLIAAVIVPAIGWYFSLIGLTTAATVALWVAVGWLVLTTASGAYPWSIPPGAFR